MSKGRINFQEAGIEQFSDLLYEWQLRIFSTSLRKTRLPKEPNFDGLYAHLDLKAEGVSIGEFLQVATGIKQPDLQLIRILKSRFVKEKATVGPASFFSANVFDHTLEVSNLRLIEEKLKIHNLVEEEGLILDAKNSILNAEKSNVAGLSYRFLLDLFYLNYGTDYGAIAQLAKNADVDYRLVQHYIAAEYAVTGANEKVSNTQFETVKKLSAALTKDPSLADDVFMLILGFPGKRSVQSLIQEYANGALTREEMIKELRTQQCLSQEALSRALNMDEGIIYQWESGTNVKRVGDAQRLGTTLQVPTECIDDFCAIAMGRYVKKDLHSLETAIDEGLNAQNDRAWQSAVKRVNNLLQKESGTTIDGFAQRVGKTGVSVNSANWGAYLMGRYCGSKEVSVAIAETAGLSREYVFKYDRLARGLQYFPATVEQLNPADGTQRIDTIRDLMKQTKMTKQVIMKETGISRHHWDSFARTGIWPATQVSIRDIAKLLVPVEYGASQSHQEKFIQCYSYPPLHFKESSTRHKDRVEHTRNGDLPDL